MRVGAVLSARGNRAHHRRSYDSRNRLSTLSFPDSNGNQNWTYTPDGLPNTVSTSNGGNTVSNSYSYNRRRLPTGETMSPDTAQTWSIGYGYNGLGQVTTETAPGSVIVSYTVNALGQTTGISANVNGSPSTLASTASYYPNGALKQFSYGNGIVHTMTQNARLLPSRSTDGTVLNLGTTFDANGNVASVSDDTASARQGRTLAYDGLDRLIGASSPMYGNAIYTYDTLDNLTRVQVTGGSQVRDHTYCYNASSNRLDFVRTGANCSTSPATIALAYDVQGNVTAKNGAGYVFDYGNRLRSAVGLTYRYDAEGRRVRQDTSGSQFKYGLYARDGRLVWQQDGPANTRINNVYLAGSLVAEISRPIGSGTPTISYFHTDALGSPIAKTNMFGTVIQTSEYEPYGALLNRSNDDRAGYTGHVMDSASGLIDMQQRMYDPQLGKYDSVDPVTAYSSPAGAFNRYWYANNNPYRFTDPDGRQSCDTCDVPRTGIPAADRLTTPTSERESLGQTIAKQFVFELSRAKSRMEIAVNFVTAMALGVGGGEGGALLKTEGAASRALGAGEVAAGSARVPTTASGWVESAEAQGFVRSQTPNGPIKYSDVNGVVRVTIKSGSSRAPGSEGSHVELRNAAGQRVNPAGNPVQRRSPENHTPIEWDLK